MEEEALLQYIPERYRWRTWFLEILLDSVAYPPWYWIVGYIMLSVSIVLNLKDQQLAVGALFVFSGGIMCIFQTDGLFFIHGVLAGVYAWFIYETFMIKHIMFTWFAAFAICYEMVCYFLFKWAKLKERVQREKIIANSELLININIDRVRELRKDHAYGTPEFHGAARYLERYDSLTARILELREELITI